MKKLQLLRVQALTFQPLIGRGSAVHTVAQQGMADTGEMNADLMGPAGLEPAAHMRVGGLVLDQFPVRYGIAGIFFGHCHAFSVGWRPIGRSTVPEGSFIRPRTTAS